MDEEQSVSTEALAAGQGGNRLLQLVASVALVAGVVLILLLGAFLKTESGPARRVSSGSTPGSGTLEQPHRAPNVVALGEDQSRMTRTESQPKAEPAVVDDLQLGRLVTRAERDHGRLVSAGSGFTLQLAAVCEPDNVQRWLAQAASDPRLYLLPAMLGGQPCFRLCYGHYASREQALQADVPARLREAGQEPHARLASEVLQ